MKRISNQALGMTFYEDDKITTNLKDQFSC